MTVLAVAGIIAGTGVAEIGSAALTVITDITLAVGSLTMLIAFLYLLALAAWRRRERRHPFAVVIPPPVPEVGDDTLAMLAQRRPAAPRRGCDEDTVLVDGMAEALNEILRGDGRG